MCLKNSFLAGKFWLHEEHLNSSMSLGSVWDVIKPSYVFVWFINVIVVLVL